MSVCALLCKQIFDFSKKMESEVKTINYKMITNNTDTRVMLKVLEYFLSFFVTKNVDNRLVAKINHIVCACGFQKDFSERNLSSTRQLV